MNTMLANKFNGLSNPILDHGTIKYQWMHHGAMKCPWSLSILTYKGTPTVSIIFYDTIVTAGDGDWQEAWWERQHIQTSGSRDSLQQKVCRDGIHALQRICSLPGKQSIFLNNFVQKNVTTYSLIIFNLINKKRGCKEPCLVTITTTREVVLKDAGDSINDDVYLQCQIKI